MINIIANAILFVPNRLWVEQSGRGTSFHCCDTGNELFINDMVNRLDSFKGRKELSER